MAGGTSNGWLIITERQLALAAWAPRAAALLRRLDLWFGPDDGSVDDDWRDEIRALLAELEETGG